LGRYKIIYKKQAVFLPVFAFKSFYFLFPTKRNEPKKQQMLAFSRRSEAQAIFIFDGDKKS
jgi:hypothetical protein